MHFSYCYCKIVHMRKKEILSVLDSLHQINEHIMKNLDAGVAADPGVLADCQESAIAVGNEIENAKGEGGEAVRLLEAYCENIYRISAQPEDYAGCRKLGKKIQRQLAQIRNLVKYDMADDRRQIVFLPYKASMWDSLESVFRAAAADPDCDAYVIPIPYYDKNPDGSLGQMHYEGDEYPADVPVVDYNSYDFQARHPDVIYIHNPYDKYNHVTSVHPFFYAQNLRQYTDMLVYIPYFVLNDIKPDNAAAVKGMEHFCVLPATVYADRVIVQSEDMRRIYINVLTETMGAETRAVWEKKICGYGSPKYDKVLHTSAADATLPEEWRRVVEKPDGSRKKVVFYNVTVSALLQYEERLLCKIRSVLSLFRENSGEVALLWRPHPLMRATLDSMRPALAEEYEEIVREYRQEGWGIYDDSADLNRAIALSDVYYGDTSSVKKLFETVGKQTIWQNVETTTRFYPIADTRAIAYADGAYWYLERGDNTLYRLSAEEFRVSRIGTVPEPKSVDLYTDAVSVGDKIFFLPGPAQAVAVYDRRREKLYTIPLREYGEGVTSKFSSGVVQGKYLYLIPCTYPALVIIDTETDETDYCALDGLRSGAAPGTLFSTGKAAVMGDDLFFACQAGKSILRYHIRQHTIEELFPLGRAVSWLHIFHTDGGLWLVPCDIRDGILLWNPETDRQEEILHLPEKTVEEAVERGIKRFNLDVGGRIRSGELPLFGYGALCGEDIYLFSRVDGINLVIHTRERRYEFWDVDVNWPSEQVIRNLGWAVKFIRMIEREGERYLICGVSREWYKLCGGRWERVRRNVSDEDNGGPVFYLDTQRAVWAAETDSDAGEQIGERIHREMKKLLAE